MRPDRPCRSYEDLTDRERRQCWMIAVIGIGALFAATVGWDALAAVMG